MNVNRLVLPGRRFSRDAIRYSLSLLLIILPAIYLWRQSCIQLKDVIWLYKDNPNAGYEVSFDEYVSGTCIGFTFLVILQTLIIVSNYSYFYRETKSYMLMKRLPGRFEMEKRCFTLPIITMVVGLIITIILISIFKVQFENMIPEGFRIYDMNYSFWRAIL